MAAAELLPGNVQVTISLYNACGDSECPAPVLESSGGQRSGPPGKSFGDCTDRNIRLFTKVTVYRRVSPFLHGRLLKIKPICVVGDVWCVQIKVNDLTRCAMLLDAERQ